MKCFNVVAALLGALSALSRGAAALRLKSGIESYTFAQFARDFDRNYVEGTVQYQRAAALFQASLARVGAVNARNAREGRPWKAGVHPFMDWTQAERQGLNGYKPGQRQAMAALQTGQRATGGSLASVKLNASFVAASPALRQQGNCGSCWAISAVEAVEAQLLKNGADPGIRLSPQALVDCVPNPRHCGGSGGCDGATGELAYSFMRDYGIPLEADLPYDAATGSCPMSMSGPWPSSQRVRLDGWNQLPSNKAEPLMQALVQQGPVVVAVDANNWFDYDSGIFDGCQQDATLGHAVLAKGYGEDGGRKYWLIQNSWGRNWGEQGHIRMTRHDDEDSWCGTDRKPQEGLGCDDGPPEVTVCGMCGILYDPLVPTGARLEGGAGAAGPPDAAFPAAPAEEARKMQDIFSSDDSKDAEAQMKALFGLK